MLFVEKNQQKLVFPIKNVKYIENLFIDICQYWEIVF